MRGLGAEMGEVVARVHARNGVDVRCGVQVAGIEGADGRVDRCSPAATASSSPPTWSSSGSACRRQRSGSPAAAWSSATASSATESLRAAPGIYAAGDCARWVNNLFGESGEEMRVEHWTNAAEQGAAAAKNLLAELAGEPPTPYAPVPFFWSDQFDSRIQYVGRAHGDDEVRVVAGDLDGRFVAMYGHGGRLRGVLGVNMPKPVMRLRKLIGERASWDEALDRCRQRSRE